EDAMILLWRQNGGFVKDILELYPEPKVPYTTLASTFKNLERKKYLRAKKLGNSWFYRPLIKENEYKKAFMGNFVSDYFRNSYKEVVSVNGKEAKRAQDELKDIIEKMQKGEEKKVWLTY